MAEFAYNNMKNISMDHISFKLNCGFHPKVFLGGKCQSLLPIKIDRQAGKWAQRADDYLQTKPLIYTRALRQYYNNHAKPWNYASGKKVWLNNKYIKSKQNCKLKT